MRPLPKKIDKNRLEGVFVPKWLAYRHLEGHSGRGFRKKLKIVENLSKCA
jgi:hypothetical protein